MYLIPWLYLTPLVVSDSPGLFILSYYLSSWTLNVEFMQLLGILHLIFKLDSRIQMMWNKTKFKYLRTKIMKIMGVQNFKIRFRDSLEHGENCFWTTENFHLKGFWWQTTVWDTRERFGTPRKGDNRNRYRTPTLWRQYYVHKISATVSHFYLLDPGPSIYQSSSLTSLQTFKKILEGCVFKLRLGSPLLK